MDLSSIIYVVIICCVPLMLAVRMMHDKRWRHKMTLANKLLNRNRTRYPTWFVDFQNIMYNQTLPELIKLRDSVLLEIYDTTANVSMTPYEASITFDDGYIHLLAVYAMQLSMLTEFIDHHNDNTAPLYLFDRAA